MFEGSTYETGHARLEPGDALVMYSDGITEAEDPAGRAVRRGGPRAHAGALSRARFPRRRRPASGRRFSTPSSAIAAIRGLADDLSVLVLSRLRNSIARAAAGWRLIPRCARRPPEPRGGLYPACLHAHDTRRFCFRSSSPRRPSPASSHRSAQIRRRSVASRRSCRRSRPRSPRPTASAWLALLSPNADRGGRQRVLRLDGAAGRHPRRRARARSPAAAGRACPARAIGSSPTSSSKPGARGRITTWRLDIRRPRDSDRAAAVAHRRPGEAVVGRRPASPGAAPRQAFIGRESACSSRWISSCGCRAATSSSPKPPRASRRSCCSATAR